MQLSDFKLTHYPNFGSAWSMVYNNVANGGWAQSGEYASPGVNTCLEHFAQSTLTSTSTPQSTVYGHPSSFCAANGQTHQVWTDFNTTDQLFFMNIDSTTLQMSYFDPATAWGWSNTIVEYYGEVGSLASNMPGNAARPTNFSDMSYQTSPTNDTGFTDDCSGFMTLAANDHDNPTHWGITVNGCDNGNVYTSVAQ